MPTPRTISKCDECGGNFYGLGWACEHCRDERRRLAELHRSVCSTPVPGHDDRVELYRKVIARGGRLFETRS